MEIGKNTAGLIKSVEWGNVTADVITEKVGSDHYQHKHIGSPKYEDITVTCGSGMSKALSEWIQQSFDLKHARNDGAIHVADFDGNVRQTVNFHQALISEVGFPALDSAGKEGCAVTVKISPEMARSVKGNGKISVDKFPVGKGEQKKWTNANFRLSIKGLEEACKKISKVEALTLKQKVIDNTFGETRSPEKVAASVEVPNLVVTLQESHAEQFYKWHEDFVINGLNDVGCEKEATLEYLTPDFKTLFTLNFFGLGIFKITADKLDAGNEQIRKLKCEMYCERIQFTNYGSGSTIA
jgi:hypothetical protein